MSLAGLFAVDGRDRLRAIRHLATPPDDATAFALRRLLFTDGDAHVRAAAARALGALPSGHAAEGWLLDVIHDRAPLVRDAVLRALAQCGTAESRASIRTVVETDGIWWVRRSAVFALGAIAGEAELPAFTAALADPFWRVRHAAVRVLAALGARDPEVRDEMIDAPPSSTLAFLRGNWGPVAVEAPARATAVSLLPAALLDPDPAVVTARVADDPEVTPLALVELLCDPHATLRAAAVKRLTASRDVEALEAALDWLEEPRIPQVGDTVIDMLDNLGEPALEVAARALARRDRPAGTKWAIEWVIASHAETLHDAVLARVRSDASPTLRRAAVALADDAELVEWAADPAVADAVAAELHARHAYAELAQLAGSAPRVRALQVDAAARRREPDIAFVTAALGDAHPGPRAIAARWLARKNLRDLAQLLSDPDPTVREAALSGLRADSIVEPAAVAAALSDVDPWVRRAAIRALVALRAGNAARAAFTDPDAGVRRIACELVPADDVLLAEIVAGTFDPDEGVRAAACKTLDRLDNVDQRIDALLATGLASTTRTAAHAWRLRRLDDAALASARGALEHETDARSRTLLDHVITALTIDPETRTSPITRPLLEHASIASAPAAQVSSAGASTERRPFGRAGFDVAPLAISGAFDLPREGLERAVAAGVDLFFWEPGYDLLARFLRKRPQLRVITGTYHADARSIRADVDRALRVLGRTALDVFLLFWTRSPARLDAATYACLDALRRQGKIRAIGFSTHHRDIARHAIEQRPWDVVMIRHSAAHPGIETELLPVARERGTAIVTFSALTYGRMTAGDGAPTPAECYRYSLAQPGVTACISAPRRVDELEHNLAALAEPSLPAERIAELRTFGLGVRAESQRFNILLRQPTRDAATAAREMLASEPAPESALRAPAPNAARRSRTRLGGRRRR